MGTFKEPGNLAVYVCRHVMVDGQPILHVVHDADGDWQFLCGGSEHDAAVGMLVCLDEIVARDASVTEVASMCTAHSADRDAPDAPWIIRDETLHAIAQTIDEHGWWVGLIDEDDEGPGFAYTLGLVQSFGHPELIVFGLRREVMHGILNGLGERVRSGERLPEETRIADVLERELQVVLRPVRGEDNFGEYLGYGLRYYGRIFPALQVFWPDRENKLPWEGAAREICALQPALQ
jgi:hypothetical protein